MASGNFDACLRPLLVHEGGNDDDPQDPGGRTSRGIIQTEYDAWRTKHGLSKRDVWTATDTEVRSIYLTEYWQPLRCDDLPAGLDYVVFDYGVNSGIYRSAWELQDVVGAKQDGEIGPQTLANVRVHDGVSIIIALDDERLVFLRGLSTWTRFGAGWSTRVKEVQAIALTMARSAVATAQPVPVPPPVVPLPRPPDDPGPLPKPPPVSPSPVQQGAIAAAIAAVLGGFLLAQHEISQAWEQLVAMLRHALVG